MNMLHNDFYHVPSREIDQHIDWCHGMINDLEVKISQLKQIKAHDTRQRKYMRRLNEMADEFDRDDFTNDPEKQIEIIRQRFDVTQVQAEKILEILLRRRKFREKERRKLKVIRLYQMGEKIARISRETGMSRQGIYNTINAAKQQQLL